MIDVRCFTNLDQHRLEKWPTKMVCRPEKGDRVTSEGGIQLKVVGLSHDQIKGREFTLVPVLVVELNR